MILMKEGNIIKKAKNLLQSPTFSFHSHRQTFLISTILTSITLPFVNNTTPFLSASIGQIFSHRPFEESFTSLAAVMRRADQLFTSKNIQRKV